MTYYIKNDDKDHMIIMQNIRLMSSSEPYEKISESPIQKETRRQGLIDSGCYSLEDINILANEDKFKLIPATRSQT